MTPNKPEWFELSEADSASSGIRKINKKLPIAAIVAAGSIILGGALFANANEEPSASASTTSVTTTSSPGANTSGANTSGANTSGANTSTNSISSPTATSAPKVSITPITNAQGNSERSGDDGKIGDRDHSDDENEGYEHENEDEDD